jgi:hypothetical protein
VNKCKSCNKLDVSANRSKNIDKYREYDRDRGNRQSNDYRREYYARYPEKRAAHSAVAKAVRSGELVALGCEICGVWNTHAHHDDYSKPLTVRWLCPKHHADVHAKL